MSTNNEAQKPVDNMEKLKQEASACGAGCSCHAKGSSAGIRWVIGAVVLAAAGVLVARAVVKENNVAPAEKAEVGFAEMIPAGPQSDVPQDQPVSVTREINSLAELNALAADTDALFLFIPGKNPGDAPIPSAQIQSASQTIEKQSGIKVGTFTLNAGSLDYQQVVSQIAAPSVLAMVKGRGMNAVSGEITEAKLVQAFVGASSAGGGCGPAAGGCGPRGCK